MKMVMELCKHSFQAEATISTLTEERKSIVQERKTLQEELVSAFMFLLLHTSSAVDLLVFYQFFFVLCYHSFCCTKLCFVLTFLDMVEFLFPGYILDANSCFI